MIKATLHYDVNGWAYHQRCLALAKYAPPDFAVGVGGGRSMQSRAGCDLALQLCYSHVRDLRRTYRQAGADPVMVAGFNVGFSEAAARWLNQIVGDADHVVVNSRLCWEAAGRPAKTSWISNGVDRAMYPTKVPPATRRPKVLWTGSVFHRRTKGYDEFLLPICRRLWREGVDCDFRLVDSHGGPTKWKPERMRDWYNEGTVYVCASETEGTPNPALEAASAGCVVCSTPVGNMPELIEDGVNGRLVDRTIDALYEGIRDCLARYQEMQPRMEAAIAEWDWSKRAPQYWELFRRLLR